jgi:hypothetical protein
MYKDEALQLLAAWYRVHVVDLIRFRMAYSGAFANPASTPLSPLIIDSTTTIRWEMRAEDGEWLSSVWKCGSISFFFHTFHKT